MEQRKHPRLKTFDYGQEGAYFITSCTKDRACLLSDVVGRGAITPPEIVLKKPGAVLKGFIQSVSTAYPGIGIDKYVIMPNHVHLLLTIGPGGGAGAPRLTVQKVVGGIKSLTRREVGYPIWQTSFYDHIIRNEADYLRIWEYIDTNPAKWAEDEYYTE